ncbi:MAG TPA: helicase C-terminal domain-containing protein [Candidatus Nitrosotalea sp.]|nr:helicase C-terminal domain-containing protein [Candidatus Nitrosotalea sp.]
MSSLLECFPEEFKPRQIQADILRSIEEQLKSGYKTIVLSAPTGVGKSLIGATLARHYGKSFVITASKQLQDQYSKDLKFFNPVKGKSNFACLKLMEHQGIPFDETKKAAQKGLTCEKGLCDETVKVKGKEVKEFCKFKPKLGELAPASKNPYCLYYEQKFHALSSDHSIWNYAAYFQLMRYGRKAYADYINKPIAVFDEAHKIEDQIIQFIGIDVYNIHITECGIDIKSYSLGDIEMVIQLLDDLARSYSRQMKDLTESRKFQVNPDYMLLAKLESRYERMANAHAELELNKDNFVINDPYFDERGGLRSLSIKPLDISSYVKAFFDIDTQVFMSATIDKASFCENTGLDPSKVAFVDTPKSPFLPDKRRINFLNVRKLSYSSSWTDELAVISKIDEILSQHASERGLILTSSEKRCLDIRNNLSDENRKRIRICHSRNENGMTQDEVIRDHAGDRNGVLLSSSLWEGVDLKDDLSRFQIIAKAPYPNLSEKRTKVKMQRFPLWYKSQTLVKLLQGFGRSIRSEEDWAVTYVLDEAANDLLYQCKQMIPRSYYDVLGFRSYVESTN